MTNQVALAEILDATSDELRVMLKKARAGHNHNGLKGGAAEEVVRKMLREVLPESLGVTIGEVADATGRVSGQSDVIIYDRQRTPMLFSSATYGSHTVPAEGVIGVIEVKSKLQKKDLKQIVRHAKALRQLEKLAYLPSGSPIHRTYNLYGREWDVFPLLYSVFAFEADSDYEGDLNELQEGVEPHERVDSVLVLDRGLTLNAKLGDVFASAQNGPVQFLPFAVPDSWLVRTEQKDGLIPWLMMNMSLYSQAETRPIDLSAYVAERLRINATASPKVSAVFAAGTKSQIADKAGLSESLAQKLGTPEAHNLSPEETCELVAAYGEGHLQPTDPQTKQGWDFLLQVPPEVRLKLIAASLNQRSESD